MDKTWTSLKTPQINKVTNTYPYELHFKRLNRLICLGNIVLLTSKQTIQYVLCKRTYIMYLLNF